MGRGWIKGQVVKDRKVPTDSVLKELYEVRGLTMKQIGLQFSVSAKQVFKHITRLGLKKKIPDSHLPTDFKRHFSSYYERSRASKPKNFIYCQRCGEETIKFFVVKVSRGYVEESFKYCGSCKELTK